MMRDSQGFLLLGKVQQLLHMVGQVQVGLIF